MDDSPRYCLQFITRNGNFNLEDLDNFVCSFNLRDCGLNYAVVAIMGPQSSGKSTLMNNLFHTNFKEMNAFEGRSQTTKGIWIAKGAGIEPLTLAMDLEGTDSRERGEDDTAFEKQSALFALATADVIMINMWCHDIGREQAASKPLLRTVLQAMMRLFSPRKTTLLFVLRDQTQTPVELLEPIIREDIQKIWDDVPKPEARRSTPLSDFFNVEVIALPSYDGNEEQFKIQVAELRQRFFNSISPGGLAGDRRGVVPASEFSISAQKIWKDIKENKDLDLPAHMVMVATVRCEEVANEMLRGLLVDEGWLALKGETQVGPVQEFGKKLSFIFKNYVSQYDMETIHFNEGVRTKIRQYLESKALEIFRPEYDLIVDHLHSKAFASFKTVLEQLPKEGESFADVVRTHQESCLLEFDKGCAAAAITQAKWDSTKVRKDLDKDIHEHASLVHNAKVSKIEANSKEKLAAALTEPVKYLFGVGCMDTWASIRNFVGSLITLSESEFSKAIAGFELDQAKFNTMVESLRSHARNVVVKIAREEAGKVLMHMRERFLAAFYHINGMPRVWSRAVDIEKIKNEALSESLRVLSDMAVIRLDENPDGVERLLFSALMDGTVDTLASCGWEGVSPNHMLKSPMECMCLWGQLKEEIKYDVNQAMSAQEAHKQSGCCIFQRFC